MRTDPMTERTPINQDYEFSKTDVSALAGATLLPDEFRREILRRYVAIHGIEELIRLFSNFIGMANSVVASNREMIELEGIVQGLVHPDRAGQLNLPTIFGAFNGISIAQKPTKAMCHGCAFRKGTPANQSPCTTIDAKDSLDGEVGEFMCHVKLDAKGKPKHKCTGAALARRNGIGHIAELEACCR